MSFNSDFPIESSVSTVTADLQNITPSDFPNRGCAADGPEQREQRERFAGERPAASEAPRWVTRGESFEENAESGETFEIFALGTQGKYKVVFTPIAKPEGEPLAALTDYLNTTFPFTYSTEAVIELVQHFRTYLGDAFDHLPSRKGGLHGYQTSFNIGKTGGLFTFGGQRGTPLPRSHAPRGNAVCDAPASRDAARLYPVPTQRVGTREGSNNTRRASNSQFSSIS